MALLPAAAKVIMQCYSVAVKLFTELQAAAFASIRGQNAYARNA